MFIVYPCLAETSHLALGQEVQLENDTTDMLMAKEC